MMQCRPDEELRTLYVIKATPKETRFLRHSESTGQRMSTRRKHLEIALVRLEVGWWMVLTRGKGWSYELCKDRGAVRKIITS